MYKPNYTITPEILTAISQIAEIKSDIKYARVLPLNEAQLKRQAIARMAHTSTSIEGNKLAQYQVDQVLSGMSVAADQRSIIEVKNYQTALIEMEKIAKSDKALSIEDILLLHKILMKGLLPNEKVGHFRPGPIYIIDDLGNGKEILRYKGPDASKVAHLTNELLKWVESNKKTLHPVLMAGIFHTQFVHIHPFSDGNGRITRILTNLILYKYGWDFKKILVLEDFYNRERQEYYNALADGWGTDYEEGRDLNPWLEYFLIGFLVEVRKVAEQVKKVGFNKSSEEPVMLDKDEMQIMDFLSSNGRLVSKDLEDLLHIAKRTAQLKLKNLAEKNLILSQGKGPSTYYILKD